MTVTTITTITATRRDNRSYKQRVRLTFRDGEMPDDAYARALDRLARKCGGRSGFHRDSAWIGEHRWLGQPATWLPKSHAYSLGPVYIIEEAWEEEQ